MCLNIKYAPKYIKYVPKYIKYVSKYNNIKYISVNNNRQDKTQVVKHNIFIPATEQDHGGER